MRRLGRIFRADGKTVIAAMDHGMGLNVNPALDKTGEILEAIVAGGADAVLTTFGIANQYQDILKNVGLILRCDGGYSAIPSSANGYPRMLFSVEDALRVGADAVACNGFPGTPTEQDCMKNVADLAAQGRAWGMPVMAEMLPGGSPHVPDQKAADAVLERIHTFLSWLRETFPVQGCTASQLAELPAGTFPARPTGQGDW